MCLAIQGSKGAPPARPPQGLALQVITYTAQCLAVQGSRIALHPRTPEGIHLLVQHWAAKARAEWHHMQKCMEDSLCFPVLQRARSKAAR